MGLVFCSTISEALGVSPKKKRMGKGLILIFVSEALGVSPRFL
jgi:hypothetical protein